MSGLDIALVHRRFTEHGGTERFLVGLARFLRSNGHEVHVYCNEIRDDLKGEPGLHFHHLPMVKVGQIAKLVSLYRSSARAQKGGHDLVMGFGRTQGHSLWRAGGGAHAAYLERCRPHWRMEPLQRIERRLDAHAATSAKVLVSPSQMAADDLVHYYGVDPERVHVIHNGVDSERFRPDPERRAQVRQELGLEGPVLAFVGTGFVRKGLGAACGVATRLGVPLIVMGHDQNLAAWKREHPQVHFLGSVAEPERTLVAADVMLLPTRYEPYGNVCLEAMACGVVPVTTPSNGVAEVFPVDGLVGQGIEELAACVETALSGGEALKTRCREAAEALPREAVYARIEGVMREMVQ